MIWSVAWRNVWRNRNRSIVMIVAIAIGIFAGVFTIAFMQGAVDARIKSATGTELAHLQVHAPNFLENDNIEFYMEDSKELLERITTNDSVLAASRRLIAETFIMAAHGTGGGKLMGIEPGREREVTDINEHLTEGTYLETTSRIPPVLIGEKLAGKLKLRVRSKINVQLVDRNGDLSAKSYRVSGIYKTSNTSFDELHLFVRYSDLRTQLGMDENVAHEIAVLLNNGEQASLLKPTLQKIAGKNDVQTWKELSPEMSMITDSMDQYMYFFIIIILMALCFGIVNTMLMAVLERTKEIGMLMAVGMNRQKIFMMIIFESVMLTLTGGVLGVLMGAGVTKIFERNPINLSMFAEGLENYGFASQVYTSLKPETLVVITLLVIITGILSAIYPAVKALKLNPAVATRTE